MTYRGVRVLVLGATGFIGRHVARELSAQGADLLLSGRSAADDDPAIIEGTHSYLRCDLMQSADVAALIRSIRPAIIFNVAGYGVRPSERDASIAERINAELPGQLAELIAQHRNDDWRGQALVHVGSALEYGTASGDLQEATVCTPTTLYGRSKLAGTQRVRDVAAKHELSAVTARLFTVYGPGEPRGRLLPALMETAQTRQALELTEGKQLRDFTYVGDVVTSLLDLGAIAARSGEPINVATGQLTSVRDFVERAARVLGIDRGLLHFGALPTRAEEMAHEPVSVRRLRELTGWVPSTSIEEGVRLTAGR